MRMRALLVLVCISVVCAVNDVFVVYNKLMVDGVEYIVKGIDYVPSPIGQSGMSNAGYGGTGFCSALLTPWNEWKSACYDSDYYFGNSDVDITRFSTGMLPIWQRDFANLKSTGANTIRLYNTNPSVLAATKVYKNLFPSPTGKDHTQFMSFCAQNGIKVIFPLFIDDSSYANLDSKTFKRYLRWQIDEVGNSPALLMWQLGNEQGWMWRNNANTWNSTAGTIKFNSYVDYIKRYTRMKWNRVIPVTAAIANFASVYNFQYTNWNVDVFSANIFGLDFGNLFTGNTDGSFDGINALACKNNKPFLITEYGPTYQTGKIYPTGAFNQIYSSIVANIKNGPLLGGLYFELTDEPALGKNFGLFGVSAASNLLGNLSTQANVFIPDAVTPKQVYNDIVSGTYNGIQYNMQANIFNLIGRNPYTISNAPDTCSTYKTCPGTGNPKCSGNGMCSRVTGTCTCADGWGGVDCSQAICPGSGCSGRGICSNLVTPPECVCNAGYFGSACQNAVSSVPSGQCPDGCTVGNGVCNTATGVCACWPGWAGPDCAVTDLGIGFQDSSSNVITPYYDDCLKLTRYSGAKAAPTSSSMTNQKCRYWCALRNYDFSSTRGTTCSCISQAIEVATPVLNAANCTVKCAGDGSQQCGGTAGYSTYIAGSAYKTGYLGCYGDLVNGRDLPMLYLRGTVTVDSCRQGCATSGFKYAGLQNANECWCGDTYGNQGGILDDSQCNAACTGDSTVYCGAGSKNSVYSVSLSAGYAFY